MKKRVRWRTVLLVTAALFVLLLAKSVRFTDLPARRAPVTRTETFSAESLTDFPPMLRVSGNSLKTPDGTAVVLTGLMPRDLSQLNGQLTFDRDLFAAMRATGANAVRIPVHPEHWRDDPDYLWRYLDPAVRWCGELGMYAIIDWHSIGNVETGTAPLMPDLYCHTKEMTLDFWRLVARHFKTAPNVLFEIFNEPQGIDSVAWQQAAVEIVGVIRTEAAQVAIVGGITFSSDLDWVLTNPLDDANVAYAAHIYPSHQSRTWDTRFGYVARKYPVLITEWGFMDENRTGQDGYLAGDASGYGAPLLSYLAESGSGWIACWYDDGWRPQMFANGDRLTKYGEFVTESLQRAERARSAPIR